MREVIMNQLALFDPLQADPLPWSVEEIASHIEAHADQNCLTDPRWSWLSDADKKKAWIAAHWKPSDYGITVDSKAWSLAYRRVGVKIGNLPEFVLSA
jgi:hypothetical protein